MPGTPPTILFDLDGTLADSAPDLCGALNRLLAEHGRPPVALSATRPHTSSGARGMIQAGFGYSTAHPEYEQLKARFLALYAGQLDRETRLFEGVGPLLDQLDSAGMVWGIVTNKVRQFTDPVVKALGLHDRAAVIVSGDTTAHAKPHPAPLLHAAAAIGASPEQCLYVGDDLRDVQAAHAAGMRAVVALYGYLGADLPPEEWGGEALIGHPLELVPVIRELQRTA
jgi:phosphoglycolate phosphatase